MSTFNQQDLAKAIAAQHAAAHDPSSQVRLVAGPGSGKSFAIEERVHWLLSTGTEARSIYAISYTRAAARDLKRRIGAYCESRGITASVQVSTVHSLALKLLRYAGLLSSYPVTPGILDEWEMENIFDAEFAVADGRSKRRCEQIRRDHEAFWDTGDWNPPNYVPPEPAITEQERSEFKAFNSSRTRAYSFVVPGEIVRLCVEQIAAGTLDPVETLNLRQLIVDEYQDLNPIDIDLVDQFAKRGVTVFVAGDDDQSVYSFRHASPAGIQDFIRKYTAAGQHSLQHCFRCTPSVLTAAQSVIKSFPLPGRISKNPISLHATATPPVEGSVQCWKFKSAVAEANGLAESCSNLIAAGTPASEIMVLLSNRRALSPEIVKAFLRKNVPFEAIQSEGFLDSDVGRMALSILRLACKPDDYVAVRVIVGLLPGVGVKTCDQIAMAVIANNLNYKDIFVRPLPPRVFKGKALGAVNQARAILSGPTTWTKDDTIKLRRVDLLAILDGLFGAEEVKSLYAFLDQFPPESTLEEVRDFLWADNDEQQAKLLEAAYTRLNLPAPSRGPLPPKVRLMTMHGSKGLSAQVVFVPGLEDEILPGPHRRPKIGLVLEAARLLYVSITRARAACILSYATSRMVNGKFTNPRPSPFAAHLGTPFIQRPSGLDLAEATSIRSTCVQMEAH